MDDDQIEDIAEPSEESGSASSADYEAKDPAPAVMLKPAMTKQDKEKGKNQFVCAISFSKFLL